VNGILVGIVHSLRDDEGIGRVRVRLPTHGDAITTEARLASPFGGKGRGFFCKPEVGDEVLIAYELGDPRRPYVLGTLWSTADPPPADDGKPEENNWRQFRSRSGHVLRFDDTEGGEKIEVIDKDGKRRIVIDTSGAAIRIECDSGEVQIHAEKQVTVSAKELTVRATDGLTLDGGKQVTIRGDRVDIN
jgi:uncharacterized protein involved in type VI secretion and phage assembly